MYLMICWIGLYFGFNYYESMQLQREAVAASLGAGAGSAAQDAALSAESAFPVQHAQCDLDADSRQSQHRCQLAVTGLSEFLRYTLDQDPMKKVTVAQEVEALNLYLSIEKMRFGERLSIDFVIDDGASTVLMPSLLLQPLIENAIKYAVSPREQGGSHSHRRRMSQAACCNWKSRTTAPAWSSHAPRERPGCRHPQYARAPAGAVRRSGVSP